jgi:hypothetical protein
MKRLHGKLTYSNVVSTLCLFLLLGGGAAYATTKLPKNSVGTKQLRRGAVTPKKLSKAAKATLTGPAGPKGATGDAGPPGPQGIAAAYAYVEQNGTVEPARSLNVTDANVTRAAAGDYCFSGLSFTVKSALANPVNVFPDPLGARVLPEVNPKIAPAPCSNGQTRVEIFNTTNNTPTDSAFIVWFEK